VGVIQEESSKKRRSGLEVSRGSRRGKIQEKEKNSTTNSSEKGVLYLIIFPMPSCRKKKKRYKVPRGITRRSHAVAVKKAKGNALDRVVHRGITDRELGSIEGAWGRSTKGERKAVGSLRSGRQEHPIREKEGNRTQKDETVIY